VDVVAFKQHADVIAGRMWACRRQACECASRCRSTLNNELIFLLGRVLSIGFDVANPAAFAQGLQELGWTIGSNLRIDYRWAA
jgi:hypothetical protein